MASLREVGQTLKESREGLGMTLDEVSQRTRISVRHLMALEEGNEADLPEIFYVRGFLKKYAEVVGLSPADVADAYKSAPVHAPTAPSPRSSVGPIAYYLLIALVLGGGAALAWQLQPKVTVVADPSPTPAPSVKPTMKPTAKPTAGPAQLVNATASPAAAAAGSPAPSPSASVFAEWAATEAASGEAASPGPTAAVSIAPAAASPARPASPAATARPTTKPTTRPTARPTAAPASPRPAVRPTVRPTARPTASSSPRALQPGQKQVDLFIQERAWVEVVVDGTVQFEGLLLPGNRRAFRGKTVEVTAGNAGGVRVTVNGKDRGVLGERGTVITTSF